MAHNHTFRERLVLARRDQSGRVRVDLGAYLRFNLWMDFELQNLVSRWHDLTPQAKVHSPRKPQNVVTPPFKPHDAE